MGLYLPSLREETRLEISLSCSTLTTSPTLLLTSRLSLLADTLVLLLTLASKDLVSRLDTWVKITLTALVLVDLMKTYPSVTFREETSLWLTMELTLTVQLSLSLSVPPLCTMDTTLASDTSLMENLSLLRSKSTPTDTERFLETLRSLT